VSLELGETINDKYRIVRLIGQGGMGAVFEGLNEAIARRVAIKVLHGGLASQAGVVERFEREAQAAGRIGNDHILEVLDMGKLANGDRFMVMEYLDGETLEERTDRLGALTPQALYPIVRQLLSGLAAAHGAGIIHRDLKPDNVFILREKAGHSDFVKIIDFGISKFTALGNDMKMTATGAVMGTPYYMSPEQAKGSRISDARSDLYSVGVILFKGVTGQVPFDASTFNELLFKIVLSETPRASQLVPHIDPAFESIILRAMAREATQRFQSAQEFIAALDAWAHSGTAVSSPPAEAMQAHPAYAGFAATGSGGEPVPQSLLAPLAGRTGGARSGIGVANTALGVSPVPLSRSAQHSHTAAVGAQTGDFGRSAPLSGNLTSGLNSATALGSVTHGTWSNSGLSVPKRSTTPYVIAGGAAAVLLTLVGVFVAFSRPETPPDQATASATTSAGSAPLVSPSIAPAAVVTPAAASQAEKAATASPAPEAAASEEAKPSEETRKAPVKEARQTSTRPKPATNVSRPKAPVVTPAPPKPKPRRQDDWGY
jgi:Protein kinase domain